MHIYVRSSVLVYARVYNCLVYIRDSNKQAKEAYEMCVVKKFEIDFNLNFHSNGY